MSVLFLILILPAAFNTVLQETNNPPSADDIARAVMASFSMGEAGQKLGELSPSLSDPSFALGPLFDAVLKGSEGNQHLEAICVLDSWGDGAWWAEIMGASFDACTHDVKPFVERYLNGDDCALLLVQYAVGWPAAILGLESECTALTSAEVVEFDRQLKLIQDTVWRYPRKASTRVRYEILTSAIASEMGNWQRLQRSYRALCNGAD